MIYVRENFYHSNDSTYLGNKYVYNYQHLTVHKLNSSNLWGYYVELYTSMLLQKDHFEHL